MKHLTLLRFVASTLFFACLTLTASAQVTTADLVGTVRDSSNAVIAGAKVTLTNDATNISRSTTSDQSGYYNFIGLQPGNYTLTVEQQGFKSSSAAASNCRSINARR